jgi:hypothetical protein
MAAKRKGGETEFGSNCPTFYIKRVTNFAQINDCRALQLLAGYSVMQNDGQLQIAKV